MPRHVKALSWLLLALAAAVASMAADLKVTSSVDKSRLRLGENVVFTVRLEGAETGLLQPSLPPLAGFRLVGTYQTVETGPEGRVLLFHYLLSPTAAGRLAVPEIGLRIAGQARTVPGFTVEVETGAPPARPVTTPRQVSPGRPVDLGAEVYLAGDLSARTAFVGQPVTYTLHLLTRRSVRGLDVVKTPDFSGFRKVEDPAATKTPPRQVRRNDHLYLDAVVVRAILFPLEPGTLTVDPFEARLRLEGGEGPGLATVVGGGATLSVTPLPAPPPGFRGAVGTFSLRLASAPPGQIDMGKALSMTLLVEGSGFLPEDPIALTPSPFFGTFPPSSEDTSGFSGSSYATRRAITLALVPKVAGKLELPSSSLVFFDPQAKAYRRAEIPGGTVVVARAGGASESPVQLSPLIANPSFGPVRQGGFPRGLLWGLLGGLFSANALLALGLWFYGTFLMAPEKRRARRLKNAARKSLYRAWRSMDVRKGQAFHEHLGQALTAAFDIRTGTSTGGLMRERLGEVLGASGLDGPSTEEALDLASALERARYAPEQVTKRDLQARYDSVALWVKGRAGRG